MVAVTAKSEQNQLGSSFASLYDSEQPNTVQKSSDNVESLQRNLENSQDIKPGLETVFFRLAMIEKELSELRKVIADYGSQRSEKVALTPLQTCILRTLAGKKMTAGEVARTVNRTRPLLVVNLHQMVALGVLEEEKKGMRVYFKKR